MTVGELIERLKEFPPDWKVWAEDREDGPYVPCPEYRDWGKPDSPDAGVYL